MLLQTFNKQVRAQDVDANRPGWDEVPKIPRHDGVTLAVERRFQHHVVAHIRKFWAPQKMNLLAQSAGADVVQLVIDGGAFEGHHAITVQHIFILHHQRHGDHMLELACANPFQQIEGPAPPGAQGGDQHVGVDDDLGWLFHGIADDTTDGRKSSLTGQKFGNQARRQLSLIPMRRMATLLYFM